MTATHFPVAIIGSGFSGLCMAIRLKQAGHHDFVVLEKADEVGGAWRENTYPGCACDVPSHLYSLSFEPNPCWSRTFSRQLEIQNYLRHCADKYGVRPHIRFGTEVVDACFDEAVLMWRLSTSTGAVLSARVVVAGLGPLHVPNYPEIDGIERFKGTSFHSARWDHGHELRNRRVAVIGTGASAVQFIPTIAPEVARLRLFQRTPPWVMPKSDRTISRWEQRLFRHAPVTQRLMRSALYWSLESRLLGFTACPQLVKLAERRCRRHIARVVADPELQAALTPDYALGCKRVLLSNDYYPALARPNVDLITSPIREVREHCLVTTDGAEHEVDTIIYGTGFRIGNAGLPRIVGASGVELTELWRRNGMQGHLGVAVSGFPNFFTLVGPNSGLGHNSLLFMIETQVGYVIRCLRMLNTRQLQRIAVRPGAQHTFNQSIQRRMDRTVWQSGCQSWYLDEQGVNRTLWPRSTFAYWIRMLRPRRADFDLPPVEDTIRS